MLTKHDSSQNGQLNRAIIQESKKILVEINQYAKEEFAERLRHSQTWEHSNYEGKCRPN